MRYMYNGYEVETRYEFQLGSRDKRHVIYVNGVRAWTDNGGWPDVSTSMEARCKVAELIVDAHDALMRAAQHNDLNEKAAP